MRFQSDQGPWGPFVDYNLFASPPVDFNENCYQTCQHYEQVFQTFPPAAPSYFLEANFGFVCDTLPFCPVIDVDVAGAWLRPCFNTNYYLDFINRTSTPATDAYIQLTLDQPLQVTSASIPYSANGNVYTFQLGTLDAFEFGTFSVEVFTPCDVPVGQTFCVEAHAFPDTCTAAPGANWDGSNIKVSANCDQDLVTFKLKNVGNGDMSNPLNYIVIEDNVLLMQMPGQFQLNSGQEMEYTYPSDGSFYRFEAQQAPGFPGGTQAIAWAEGCGDSGNLSLGFTNQYNLGDDQPWIEVFCLESLNAYDPNDKQGFPRGVGDKHYIDQNVDLEYMIRFQNTGTAPAVNIEIRDTLPVQWLQIPSLRVGASSHPYQFDLQDNGVLVFSFPNINLPDSSANFDASQGFVKFRISQQKDLPLETQIKNTAAIYFDFNEPIITNQTLHTIGKDYLVLSNTQVVFDPRMEVQVMPNPAVGNVLVLAKGLENTGSNLSFRLISMLGQPVLQGDFSGNTYEFDAAHLPSGVYGYEIRNNGQLAASGKILKM